MSVRDSTHSAASEGALGATDNPVGGRIKCQQISGGDGFATMGDGTQTYLFGFGPLSGLSDMASGLPGTQVPSVFNTDNTTLGFDPIFIGAPVNQSDGTI